MKFKEAVTYDEMLMVPQYSDIVSRNEVDIKSYLGDREFSIPIIASPMDTISETEMAKAMGNMGGNPSPSTSIQISGASFIGRPVQNIWRHCY